MTEPTTKAGRALSVRMTGTPNWMLRSILAIEAEAREGVTLTREPGLREALVAQVSTAFDEYLWGLAISPQPASGPCEESVRYFRDSLLADLVPEETEAIERHTDHARNKALANWEHQHHLASVDVEAARVHLRREFGLPPLEEAEADAIIAALAEQGVTLTREPGLRWDLALADVLRRVAEGYADADEAAHYLRTYWDATGQPDRLTGHLAPLASEDRP